MFPTSTPKSFAAFSALFSSLIALSTNLSPDACCFFKEVSILSPSLNN